MTLSVPAEHLFATVKTIKNGRRLLLFSSLLLCLFFMTSTSSGLFAQAADPAAFVTTWRTTAAAQAITIPVNTGVTGYDYTVDWGDGTSVSANQTGSAVHTYATAGDHTVTISGTFPAIQFGGAQSDAVNDAKLIRVNQWGTGVWQGMDAAFDGCSNLLTVSTTDAPIFASNSTLYRMFAGCTSFNSNLNSWNLTPVRETSYMFYKASSFNGAIGAWDMSNVTNTQFMFFQSYAFNQDISGWQLGSLTRMDNMFKAATAFNQNIGAWDVSMVQFMANVFEGASDFDQDLGNWDIISATDITKMLSLSGMSQANYDATLIGWAPKNVKNALSIGVDGLHYCAGSAARDSLINDHQWVFLGDVNVCSVSATPDVNGVVYVDSSIVTPGTGNSWGTALKYASDALSAANGDTTIKEIHVAKGTYYPTGVQSDADRNKSFVITRGGLLVLGGYPSGGGSRTLDGSHPSILSGDINVMGDSTDNSYHVVIMASVDPTADSLIVEGFTISGGNANEYVTPDYNGVTVNGLYGGGIFGEQLGANTVVRHCIFENNSARVFGGGLYIAETYAGFNHLTLQNNHSENGGGIFVNTGSTAHLSDLTIINNQADSYGGGFFSQTNSGTVVDGALISGNRAREGGGIANQGDQMLYYNVQVTGNLAELGGGVADNHSFSRYTNATISGNRATNKGGGVYVEFGSALWINSIIYNNAANEANELYASGGSGDSTTLLYCNVSNDPGDITIGTDLKYIGATAANPLFVQPLDPQSAPIVGGNYDLMDGSPVIDAGLNDSIPDAATATDLLGNARINHGVLLGIVDLGAFESAFGKIIRPDNNGILYVDSSIAVAGDGSSWTEALQQLSTAAKLANLKSEVTEIHVAKGTYYPTGSQSATDRQLSFNFSRGGLKLLGGYPNGGGSRDMPANPTILSGNINAAGDVRDNSLRIVAIKGIDPITDSLVLDGFTVSGGYANSEVMDYDIFRMHMNGAGIYLFGAIGPSVCIRNCTITHNYAYGGSGLMLEGVQTNTGDFLAPSPVIQHCLIDGNELITENVDSSYLLGGAGICGVRSNAVFDNCSITNNKGYMGAGIFNYLLSRMTIKNSVISGNESNNYPALVSAYGSKTGFINCLINNNTATGNPAQPNTPVGFMASLISAQISLINSTVVNNQGLPALPGSSIIINQGASNIYATNSIFWGNSGDFLSDDSTGVTQLSYSLIQGLAADPSRFLLDGTVAQDLFVDSANGNFQLKAGAIAVNAGLNDSIQSLEAKDLAGQTRINAQTVDLGAFEFLDIATPVTMSALQGIVDERQHALLSWKTFTENGNKGFTILRSDDGQHFVKAGFVASKAAGGNSQSTLAYRFDAGFIGKSVYLRIEQTDLNGQPAYSNIIHLQPGATSTELLVYPNPVHDVLNVQLPAADLGLHPRILIIDLSGRVVLRKELTAAGSKVNVARLAAGIYLLKYMDDQKTKAVRFIKK